ncbi:hypothetical protein DFR26_0480 [Paraperlucidibaca baekdonensis]|uniref:Uncharacterized protein n=1 Tax=Paraperlucidibaca baekdonensis TaxID=748120 RepID=A0A3E0H9R7_9GAMM|nr:hypothetical protein DFR26_0480 [Paraperlucidibaca baekdonensis]
MAIAVIGGIGDNTAPRDLNEPRGFIFARRLECPACPRSH